MENTFITTATENNTAFNVKDFLAKANESASNQGVKLTTKELVMDSPLTINFIKPIVTKTGEEAMIVKFDEKPNAYAFAPTRLRKMLKDLIDAIGLEQANDEIKKVKIDFNYGEEFESNGETITPITIDVI